MLRHLWLILSKYKTVMLDSNLIKQEIHSRISITDFTFLSDKSSKVNIKKSKISETLSFKRKGAYLTMIFRSLKLSISICDKYFFFVLKEESNWYIKWFIFGSSLGWKGINFKRVYSDSLCTSGFESFRQSKRRWMLSSFILFYNYFNKYLI